MELCHYITTFSPIYRLSKHVGLKKLSPLTSDSEHVQIFEIAAKYANFAQKGEELMA